MTNSILVKKAFSAAVAATTILWSVGLSAFLPTAASAATFGDLIKGTSLSTVYYYGSDGQRYAFPNEKTYFSWYKDFASVKTISDSELASITLAGNIKYRPGARWVKITSDNKVYVVSTNGKVRWVENEATAKGLGGDAWNAHIDDVPDVFFTDYTVGDSLTSAAAGYDGMLWSDATGTYRVSGSKYQKVSDAGFAANGFNAGFVLKGTGFTKAGLTAGDEVTAGMSNLTDAAQKVTSATYAVTQNVTVSLDASSPSASTFLALQGLAHVASLNFSNPTSSAVTVRGLTLKRTGVSADATLANSYLFDGWMRLSDASAVSSGSLKWNDASGLFTIPAGGSKVVTVRSDLADAAGQTLGVKLASGSDVVFTGAFSAAGTFPLQSATHTIAAAPGSGFTSVTFGTATPSSDATLDAQNDYSVWTDTVTVANNEAMLYAMRFRNVGSINAADLGNWRLYIDGVQKGSAVAKQDSNGYVSFDFSAAPVLVKSGAHTFKVMVDVTGGTNRTIVVGLRNSADAVFVDEDYNQPDLAGAGSFAGYDTATQTVNAGSLSVTKATDSPSGKVTIGATNAVLGRWVLKASGEAMKAETLRFMFTAANDSGLDTLLNGAVYTNGTQIGSTTTLNDSGSYTQYSFGSSLVVYPGSPVTVELRADIDEAAGADSVSDGDTIQANVAAGASTNVLRMSTGSYTQVPATAVPANTVTVSQGAFTGAKNTSYASQTIVAPKTAYKVGSYTITSSTTESINLTGLTVDLDGSSGESAGEINNLYVEYGKVGAMTTSSTKTSPSLADAGNVWSVNTTVAPGSTLYVNVYADVDSSIDATDTIITTLDFTGTTVDSGVSADNGSAITGQTITIGSGSFTPALDGSTPVAFMAAANQEVSASKFRFTASNENYSIKEVQLSVPAAVVTGGNLGEARVYDGSTLLGSAVFSTTSGDSVVNGAALITGLNVPVASNSYKVLTAKLVLNDVGVGAASSQVDVKVSLDSVKYADSQGTETTYSTDVDPTASIYAFKTIPTVSLVDLTNSTLVNGQATDLYKFTVTASSNGPVALKQFKLTTSWTDGGTADTLEVESLKLYKNGSDVSSSVTIVDEDGNLVSSTSGMLESDEDMVVTFTDEDTIAAGETTTYVVRGTPSGFHTSTDAPTDSVGFYLAQDSATNSTSVYLNQLASGQSEISQLFTSATTAGQSGTAAEFIWSDVSAASHVGSSNASSTGDWHNGFLVKNLDLSSETWTK